jgi:fructose-bisphosphate aldolase class II
VSAATRAAELGVDAAKRDKLMVDPASAADSVRETGVDTIASEVGTVRGLAPGEAQVDLERLEPIRAAVPCFISTHGGSGLKPADLRRAAELGITKISYFTGLSKAAVKAVSERTTIEPEPRLTGLLAVAQGAIEKRVFGRITAFGSAGRALAVAG